MYRCCFFPSNLVFMVGGGMIGVDHTGKSTYVRFHSSLRFSSSRDDYLFLKYRDDCLSPPAVLPLSDDRFIIDGNRGGPVGLSDLLRACPALNSHLTSLKNKKRNIVSQQDFHNSQLDWFLGRAATVAAKVVSVGGAGCKKNQEGVRAMRTIMSIAVFTFAVVWVNWRFKVMTKRLEARMSNQ